MGSRVITQSVPDSLTYSHIMVASDTEHAQAAVDSRPHSTRSSAPGDTSPPSHTDSRNIHQQPQPSGAARDVSEANYAARANQQQYHPRNHPSSRQYDQAGFPLTNQPQLQSSPNSPRLQPTHPSMRSLAESAATSPSRIKVRDLSHIQSFASEEYLSRPRLHQRTGSSVSDSGRQYEISAMPVTDIIEMVAGLLTKITATNDRNHDQVSRPIPLPEDHANMSAQTTSVLAFHGKNVPSITILSYLSRIHKYCPTTYEVFLSLLVYFDRMTEVVNRAFLIQAQQRANAGREESSPSQRNLATPPASENVDLSDRKTPTQMPPSPPLDAGLGDAANFFVVDSFNIHRLVIAGVTCASKFFSDVFYTNSRYAKVGGLPLIELNHLELQFLILNDFRLSIPVEELEAYGTMLVEFYAREIVAQQQAQERLHQSHHQMSTPTTPGEPGGGVYMRDSSRATANQATTA